MKKKYFLLILLPFIFVSCAAQNKNSDSQADSRLGVEDQDDNQTARSALQQLQQTQLREQRRQMERQISEPLSG